MHSAEVRWFLEGKLPEEVRAWFSAGGLAVDETPRIDEYLVLPGCTNTGVKFRQYPGHDRASFEIKARTSDPAPVSFNDSADGLLETWVKWSCRPADVASFRASIEAGAETWGFVEKRRCLRKFSMDGAAPVEVPPVETRPAAGCQIELTAIGLTLGERDAANGDTAEHWWSLSFEAFGPRGELPSYVTAVAGEVLPGQSVARLDKDSSFGYPAFLDELMARSGLSGPR